MANPTQFGNRVIDPALTERFARSIASATEKVEQLSKAFVGPIQPFSGGFSRTSRSPSEYGQDVLGMPGGSYSRKSMSPGEYQASQQSQLASQAGWNPTTADPVGLSAQMNMKAKNAQTKATEQFGETSKFLEASGQGDMAQKGMLAARAAAGDPTAIAQLAKEGVEEVQKRFESAGKHAWAGATESSSFRAAGHGMRGAGDVAGMFSPIAEKALKFGAALVEGVDRIQQWGNSLHEANIQFSQFSGSMAAVSARQEVRDIQLSRERGNRRAEDAEDLAKAKNRLDRAVAPIDDAWNKLQMQVATWMLTSVAPVVEKLGEWLGTQSGPGEGKLIEENEWMVNVFRDKGLESQGRPQRFGTKQ